MIKKMLISGLTIATILLAVTFYALRIPVPDVPPDLSRAEKLNRLDKWLEELHQDGKFNGVVLLSKNAQVLFSKAYGFDSASAERALNIHSSFNLASVSKQFTAMGIVLLESQSKLHYDDRIDKYLPELSFYKDISIRYLLHHTSGLPDYISLAEKYASKSEIFTSEDLISLFVKHQPALRFEPGTRFKYSNTGYVLLAEIIQRVSAQKFDQFMAENIFIPLKMHDTQVFNLLSINQPEHRVYGYSYTYGLFGGGKQSRDLNHYDGVAGDGGVYSSAYDLQLWHQALRNGVLVPAETYDIAYQPAVYENKPVSNYGFGWFINGDGSVEHAGGWQGFSSYILRHVEKDELIVLLDNSSNVLRVNSYGFRINSIGLNLKQLMRTL